MPSLSAQKAWRAAHPNYGKEWHKKQCFNDEFLWYVLVKDARIRNINVDEVAKEDFKAMMHLPCFYCASLPDDQGRLNGIDRVNSLLSYSISNTVPCCMACNYIKRCLPLDIFVAKVRSIVLKHSQYTVQECFISHQAPCKSKGRKRLRDITEKQEIELLGGPCYLCDNKIALGIDRVDANGDYTPENSASCCFICNFMKGPINMDSFMHQLRKINLTTSIWVLQKGVLDTNAYGKPLNAVAATTSAGDTVMVFTSSTHAAQICGGDGRTIDKAIAKSNTHRGMYWQKVDGNQLLSFCPTVDAVSFITSCRSYNNLAGNSRSFA